jgi:type I restriction enzyme S subunit
MSIDMDLGLVPEGWSVRSLPEVCSMRSGGTPPKTDPSLWNGTMPWVSGKDLKAPRLYDAIDHITHEAAEDFSKVAPAGSVLVLVRGMGLANGFALSLIERPMAFNQDLKALTPKDGLLGAFLMHALTYAGARMLRNVADAAHGTKRLSQDDLDTFRLPIPPLAEQRAIAEVLDRALAALDVERKALRCSEDIKHSSMKELFSHGVQRGPRKETAVGTFHACWTETTLGELCVADGGRIQTGPFGSQLHAHEYQPDGVPVINPTHLGGNQIERTDVPRVSPETASRLERHKVEDGDILFARRGEIGRHGLVSEHERGWLCGTGCFVVRVRDPRVENSFLSRFFSTEGVLAWLSANAAGSIMPNLNNTLLTRLPVIYPSREEQAAITTIADTIDRKLAVHERRLATLDALYKTLLDKLMSGAVRVSDLDLAMLAAPSRDGAIS